MGHEKVMDVILLILYVCGTKWSYVQTKYSWIFWLVIHYKLFYDFKNKVIEVRNCRFEK